MFKNGTLVTLIANKSHGEGEDAITLKSGICGMVVAGTRKQDGNHQYTVDFGAYGGWYCNQNELTGDDTEGWEGEPQEEVQAIHEPASMDPFDSLFRIVQRPTAEPEEDDDEDDDEESEPEQEEDYSGKIIDVEKDIQRRMEEIEKGQ
jgi:hypothetical protein